MELYWSLKRFVPWLYPYFTASVDKHASCHSLTVTHPPGTHTPCEPSWKFLWGCCDGRNGWIACQWSYIEASKALFHGSTHILQLLKTNMPHVTRWQSYIHQAPDVKYTWEIDQSWCTPHDWTLLIIFWVIFDSREGFYGLFHFSGQKMSPKAHIASFLTFPTTNTPVKWINLDVLPMTGLCGSFHGWFLIVTKVFMAFLCFRVIWSKNWPTKN